MLWIKLGTHIKDHPRFLALGALARDLWVWGMLYSGDHELDGDLPMAAVMTSAWGRGDRANVKLAGTLVSAGLWERTESGWRILRWAEQGNQTKAQLSADREAARERKERNGSGKVRANEQRTNTEVPTSTSLSCSGSDLSEGMQGETLERTAPLTDDARQVFDSLEMVRPTLLDVAVVWLGFCGHNADQRFPSRAALLGRWQKWVTQQGVFAAKDREKDRVRADQEAERKRFAREGPEKPPPPTRAQSQAMAEELARRVMGNRKVGS